MTRTIGLKAFTAALAVGTALTGIAPAYAQIEEIVVTTRKRAENLQEVPIVITAFTSEAIERKGIVDLADIAKYTSGVNLDEGFSKQDTRVVIRGLSPTRGRQNVAILQDEVDISSLAQGTAGGSFVINPRLLDVERIEVVKGPHPALFGRSAFSGAINYISKKPGDEFLGNAQADVGSDNKYEARVSMSGPILADKLSIGVNGSVWNFGGFYDSTITGKGLGGGDGYGVAGSFTVTPTETLTLTGRVEYSNDDYGPEARFALRGTDLPLPALVFTTATGATAPVIAPTPTINLTFPQPVGSLGDADRYRGTSPSRNPRTGEDYPGSSREIFRNTLRISFETDPVLFTSISHYGDNTTFQFVDSGLGGFQGDFRSPNVTGGSEVYFDTDIRLVSQELRAQSNGDDALKWTVGGLIWNELLEQTSRSPTCVGPAGGCGPIFAGINTFHNPPNSIKRDTHHYSVYGLAGYEITDKLKAEVELRWTQEMEDTAGFTTTSPTFLGCPSFLAPTVIQGITSLPGSPTRIRNADGTLSCANTALPLVTALTTSTGYTQVSVGSAFVTPRFTLDYKATDDALLYASVGLGKKPGGLSPLSGVQNAATNTYDPEEMWVYEVGAKTTWMDGRLQLNGALYYQDYAKKQVSVTQTTTVSPFTITRVVNAAKAEVKGLELDANLAPTDFFSASISYTYNDGQYKDFSDISNSASGISRATIAQPVNACKSVIAVGTGSRCVVDYSGNRLEGAAKHSLQLGGEIRGDVAADLQWFFDADARFQTKRFTSFENSLSMDSFWTADVRGGLRHDDWSITAYVNNVFNDDTIKASAVYIQDWSTSYIAPRNNSITSLASGILPDRRQLGVRASLNF
jgi:outer membrane receptor protein involved in Fe transport